MKERGAGIYQKAEGSSLEYCKSKFVFLAALERWDENTWVWVSLWATRQCLLWDVSLTSSSNFSFCFGARTENHIPLQLEWAFEVTKWQKRSGLFLFLRGLAKMSKSHPKGNICSCGALTESLLVSLIFSNNFPFSCCAGPVNLR